MEGAKQKNLNIELSQLKSRDIPSSPNVLSTLAAVSSPLIATQLATLRLSSSPRFVVVDFGMKLAFHLVLVA